MNLLTLLLLALSLAMDAFAVSVCGGIVLSPSKRWRGGVCFGWWFGSFQALMPCIGYYAAVRFHSQIEAYDHWIAFLLLVYLGCNMLREAKASCPMVRGSYSNKEMFTLALATSIDALAVGVSLAFLQVDILCAAFIIGSVTFAMSLIGCVFGSHIGEWGKEKAEIAGGVILILLGCKILIEHTGGL